MNAMAEDHWQQLPLRGPLLIEASAGTGKTYTLALLYLRLLLCRDDLDPAGILVVSFTEAATAELRERLRARLIEVERLLRAIVGQRPPEATDRQLLAWLELLCTTPEQAAELLARVERARLGFDQAAIHTIHGFCARVLSDFAFATGAALERGQALDADALLRELVYDWWRGQLESQDPQRLQVLAGLGGPAGLWKTLRPAFNLPDSRVLAVPDSAPLCAEYAAAFAALASAGSRAELGAVLNAPERQFSLRVEFRRQLQAIDDWLAAGTADAAPALRNPDTLFDDPQKSRPKPERALGEVPVIARLRDLLTLELRRRDALRAELFAELIVDLRQKLVARCRRVPGHTYGDLIAEVAGALGADCAGTLAARLRARWPVALVDEFQDTDLAQFSIFRRIYDDGRQGLLALIGDAKQAIYAFRGGDVQVCREARQLPDRHTHTLRVNYRSAPRLVAAVNQLFIEAGAKQVFGEPAIDFVAAHSPRAALAADAARPFALVLAEADPEADPPRAGQARERCIAACADAVAASLNDPAGVRPVQLAVLVNRNQDVAALRRALARRGVPVAAQVQQSVFESRAADSLRILLAALAEPGREDRLRAALLGPWFAWSVDQVAALANTDPGWSALLDQFALARLRWQQHGPAAALLPWLQQASAGLLAASAAAGDGERFLTDARHLLELLQSEFARRPGIAELLDWLDRGGEDDALARSDERLLRLESDGDRVRVLTLHGAKGLEFDRVWLPLLWTPPPGSRAVKSPAYAVCHQDGERVIDTGGADFAAHLQAEQADREAEATRLLYVGLTRARAQCTLYYPQRLATQAPSALTRLLLAIAAQRGQGDDLTATLYGLAAPADSPFALSTEWPQTISRRPHTADPGGSSQATAALPDPRPFETLWSFTRLHQGGHAQALVGEAIGRDDEGIAVGVEAEPGNGLPDTELGLLADLAGPGFGSALHALFEQALTAESKAATIDNIDIRRSLRRFGFDPLAPAALDAIGRLLGRCLATELAPGLCLGALPAVARAAEWTFELPLTAVVKAQLEALLAAHGHVQPLAGGAQLAGALSGSADLLFEWQGRFYIVDYKSNWLGAKAGDYAADGLALAMQEAGYTLQYLLYTVALQRYLRRRIGAAYDYAQHFGGVYYLFVRAFGLAPGLGLHYARPEADLIAAIDQLFDGHGRGVQA